MQKIKKKLIIFDFDGVIIDSKKNMFLSWLAVQKKLKTRISFNKYFQNIGVPFEKILKKIKFYKNFLEAKKIYEKTSKKHLNQIHLFKDVKITLNFLLKNYTLCLVTSKNKKRTKKILKKLKIINNFKHIYCPEDRFPSKPNPEVVKYLKKKYKLKSAEVLIVGDTIHDKNFAKKSKVNFVYASYGYGKFKSKYKIKSFKELIVFLIRKNF
jgi:phosphoglycolate phosphatase